jgi:hypothetical protein
VGNSSRNETGSRPIKYWEIIADNLSKAGWSWGRVSAIDSNGRTIFVGDAHRGELFDFKRSKLQTRAEVEPIAFESLADAEIVDPARAKIELALT